MSVTAALSTHARRAPEDAALSFGDNRLTWGELDLYLHRLAARIAARVPPGRGVALHLPTGPALALLFLATARAGREAQVLDPEWPMETTRALLDQLVPAVLVTADRNLSAPETIVLDRPAASFRTAAGFLAGTPENRSVAEPDPALPFYVGFTSGSTGLPKGYRRDHRSWLASFEAEALEFGIGEGDAVLAPGTLTHSLFLYALVHGLHSGARVVLCRRFRPDAILRILREQRITILYGVPTQLGLIAAAADAAPEGACDNVRWVLSSGAKLSADVAAALRRLFPMARIGEFYGASELSFITVAKDGEGVPESSVGRPFHNVNVTVRDRRGRRLPTGRTGFIFVESPSIFMGYASGNATDLLRTGKAASVGDIGFFDVGGFLHLVGRANRMIVTSGKNVYPEEIERVLASHPAVQDAAVLGQPDARRGERLTALLRLREDWTVRRADLIAHARARLPLYKVPRIYAVVPDWPLTRSGKPSFEALGRLWSSGAGIRLS